MVHNYIEDLHLFWATKVVIVGRLPLRFEIPFVLLYRGVSLLYNTFESPLIVVIFVENSLIWWLLISLDGFKDG